MHWRDIARPSSFLPHKKRKRLPSSTLLSLPDELLDHIVQYLRGPEDGKEEQEGFFAEDEDRSSPTQNLLSVCKTNKRLRSIAEQYLYKNLGRFISNEDPLYLYRTFCERPSLARYARTIEIVLTDHSPLAFESNRELQTKTLKNCRPDLCGLELEAGIHSGCASNVLIAILAMTSRIQTLKITYENQQILWGEGPGCAWCVDFESYLRRLLTPYDRAVYTHLSQLRLTQARPWPNTNERQCAIFCDTIGAVLQLPKLESFEHTGAMVAFNPVDDEFWQFSEASSRVKCISLDITDIDSDTLSRMMRFSRELTKVNIRWAFWEDDNYTGIEPWDSVNLNTVVNALARHRNSLKDLTLTNVLDDAHLWITHDSMPPLLSFSKLQHLTIDHQLLLHEGPGGGLIWVDFNEKLPSTLEHLKLHTETALDDLDSMLRGVSTFKGEKFRHLEITYRMHRERADEQEAVRLYGPGFEKWTLVSTHEEGRERAKFGYECAAPISESLSKLSEVFEERGIVCLLEDQVMGMDGMLRYT